MKTRIYTAPAVKGFNWDDEERDHGDWSLTSLNLMYHEHQSHCQCSMWCRTYISVKYGHSVLFLCFRLEKIQNLMREGGKKTFKKKKTSNLFLEKLMRASK